MNIFGLSGLLIILTSLPLGLFFLFKKNRTLLHAVWGYFSLSVAGWGTGALVISYTQDPALSLLQWRLTHIAVILIPVLFFAFIQIFLKNKLSISTAIAYGLGGIFFISNLIDLLTGSRWFISDVRYVFGQFYYDSPPTLLYILFVIFFIGSVIYTHIQLLIRYLNAKGIVKKQIEYFFLATAVGFSGGSFSFLPVFGVNFYPFLNLTVPLYPIIMTIGILQYQLFDIRVVIKRTLVYSGLLLFAVTAYSMVIFFFATFFGTHNVFDTQAFVTNLIAAGIIAIGFEPLRKWLVKVTDKYLFVGEYNAQEVISELAQTLNNVLDLDEALLSMMGALTKALRVGKAATFILTLDKEKGFQIKRVVQIGYSSMSRLALKPTGAVVQHFSQKNTKPLLADELRDLLQQNPKAPYQHLISELEVLDAAVALPIRVKDRLIGILVIGPRLSGDIFGSGDLQFLDIAAKQTATAIEKSRFYEDDQLKSEFVSIASHELLTPAAAIEGYLSMILDEKMAKVDPKAEGYLKKVQSSARRLSELVTDLLSISRIESGRIVINKKPVEVSPIINQVIGELKVKADQAKVGLGYLAPTQPIPKVLADPDRLAQIITNLISNAIKYNRPGGQVQLTVGTDRRFVIFQVADNGIGIGSEHLPHLFEKFYRVQDDSAAAEKVGTGLGLYITRSIIELQGGRIGVKSVLGKGSVFSFTLPAA